MYTNLGYIIYRTILEYYSGDQDEDAYGEWTCSSSWQNVSQCRAFRCRYEKGDVQGREQEVGHTVHAACTIGRYRYELIRYQPSPVVAPAIAFMSN